MPLLFARKLGMSRIFDEKGNAIAVTAVTAESSVVTQLKTTQKDGYAAVQIGTGTERHAAKPQAGHTKTLASTPKYLTEFPAEEDQTYTVGQTLDHTVFNTGDRVKIIGTSKGKGFAGVIKRHHFHRGPMTHGSDHHRAPGSIGSMFPQHVWKGKKMPGHLGTDRVTTISTIVDILPDERVLLIKGALPGSAGTLLTISVQS